MGGGQNWKVAGQWIEYEVDVPNEGFYELTLKTRQNYTRGFVSCRSLYINGEIPFEEVSTIKFDFDNDWNLAKLADKDGNPYLFKLKAGKKFESDWAIAGGLAQIVYEEEGYRVMLDIAKDMINTVSTGLLGVGSI